MTSIPSLFEGFKISNYYRFVLYLSAITWMLSFFVPVQNVDVAELRHFTITLWVAMLVIWFLEGLFWEIYKEYARHIDSGGRHGYRSNNEAIQSANIMHTVCTYVLHVVTWVAVFSII